MTRHTSPVAVLAIVMLASACGGATTKQRPHATTGGIMGLTRDQDSGDPVGAATVGATIAGELAPHTTSSNAHGMYFFEDLPPGTYTVVGQFAGQPIEVDNVAVDQGLTSTVDIMFTLGHPDPIKVSYAQLQTAEITHFHPTKLAAGTGVIEGTVNDATTNVRVVGAVISVTDSDHITQLTASDDQGHWSMPNLIPGTYSVSASYTISTRGQIEVRRSNIAVAAGDGVRVPMLIETTK